MGEPLPPIGAILPRLQGDGVFEADPGDASDIALALLAAGYVVRELDGRDLHDRRRALRALSDHLRLPGAAEHNLDALADTLRDLPDLWPGTAGLALLWHRAEDFREGDEAGWDLVTDILADTTDLLADHGFAFTTVVFLDGYDIPPLMLGVPRKDPRR